MVYKLSDYDYDLPKELIAQRPVSNREKSRLLVFNRKTGAMVHTEFAEIVNFLDQNDVLVINDTKVIPARLFGKKETGGKVEILLLHFDPALANREVFETEALVRASRAPKPGQFIYFADNLKAEVLGYNEARYNYAFSVKALFGIDC